MIVRCPDCSARLRLDPSRLGGKRLTLRCARCRKVFKAEVPTPPSVAAPEEPALKVLVAHNDPDLCRTVEEVLQRAGLASTVCHDGRQALAAVGDSEIQVALLDVALPEVLAFEVIDEIRRHPQRSGLGIILLSSVYNKMAYKRTPGSLYGADDYIEKHHIPDDLVPKIHRLIGTARSSTGAGEGADTVGEGVSTVPEEEAFAISMNSRLQQAEERETASGGAAATAEKARRLARIIVADIALYNQERVDEGIRTDRFFQLLAGEIEEGRRLFRERLAGDAGGSEPLLTEAFDAFIERRRAELGLAAG